LSNLWNHPSPTCDRALELLAAAGELGLTPRDLSRLLVVSPSRTHAVIRQLLDRGLVEVERTDGRRMRVFLSFARNEPTIPDLTVPEGCF
jgi:DNA-binding MarR family transcriptional regulator